MKQVEQLLTESGHSQKEQSHFYLLKDALFRLGFCIPGKNPNRGSRRGLEHIFVKTPCNI